MKNKYKYLLYRINSLFSGIVLSLVSILFKKTDRVIINSSQNNSFNHNSKYVFKYLLSLRDFNCDFYYVIEDDELRYKLSEQYGNYFISPNGIRNKWFILMSKLWLCSTLETPVGGVFLCIGRCVVHMGHGMPYKSIGHLEKNMGIVKKIYYRLNATNFSFYLATTPFFKDIIMKVFDCHENDILISPQPRADAVNMQPYVTLSHFESLKIDELNRSNSTNILYAPTWRHYSDTKLFPFIKGDLSHFNQILIDKDIVIWLRPHPFFSIDTSCYSEFSNIKLLTSNEIEDINIALGSFDALMTDYSSIFLDFIQLERPVFFVDYDLDDYIDKVGLVPGYERLKCGLSLLEIAKEHEVFTLNVDIEKVRESNLLANYNLDSKFCASEYLILKLKNMGYL